jgi:hypothetical protein
MTVFFAYTIVNERLLENYSTYSRTKKPGLGSHWFSILNSAVTGISFFGIYWDFLINPYTFLNKSRNILRVKAKAIVRVRAKTQLMVKARGQPSTEGARKS